jgi:hypothetical protein
LKAVFAALTPLESVRRAGGARVALGVVMIGLPRRKMAAILTVVLLLPITSGLASEPATGSAAAVVGRVKVLGNGFGPDVAVDRAGNTTVVWSESGLVKAVRRPRGAAWGKAVTIGQGDSAQVDVDSRGNVTALWLTPLPGYTTGISTASQPVGAPWGAPVLLVPNQPAPDYEPGGNYGAGRPALAVARGGAVVAAWEWGGYDAGVPFRIQAAYRPAEKPWDNVVDLTAPNDSEDVRVAIDHAGTAVVLYRSDYGHGTLKARRRVVGGGWTSPVTLTTRDGMHDVAVDARGNVTAVFTAYVAGLNTVRAVRRPVGGPWSKARKISGRIYAWSVALAVDGVGGATAAWESRSSRMDSVRRPPRGPWGPPKTLAPVGPNSGTPTLAANARGDVLAVWSGGANGALFGKYRAQAGTWGRRLRVNAGTDWVGVFAQAVYRHGDAVCVWEEGDRILARRLTLP